MTKLINKTYSKWTPSANGYKATGRSFGNSSFWMDDDFLTSNTTISEGSKVDVIKLAGYRKAIGNFVNIVTGKDDIKVKYSTGSQSYTDGKTVVISSKLDENEFDSTVGLALHEGSHIALTNFKTLNKIFKQSPEVTWLYDKHNGSVIYDVFASRLKNIVNIIEDRRIDRYIYDNAPGYKGYYQALYDKYFNAKEIDNALLSGTMTKEDWDCYEFHICNFANPNRQLSALKALRKVWNTINLSNISRLKSTDEVLDLSMQVYEMIFDEIGWEQLKAVPTQDAKQDAEGDEETESTGNEGSSSDDSNDDEGDSNMDMPQGSTKDAKTAAKEAKAQKDLEKAIEKQKAFVNGEIKKKGLSQKDETKVEAAAESSMTYENVGGKIDGAGDMGKVECVVIKGVSKRLVDSGMVHGQWADPAEVKRRMANRMWNMKDYVQEGITLGTLLGKRLKTRDENRSLTTTRMETGRIDKRLIAELGFGNDRVFSQTIHNTVTPGLIHISLDASGSMNGRRWHSAVKTAVAIAKAASMISSLDVIISTRGSIHMNGKQHPLMWVVYDSRKDKFASSIDIFYGIQADGSTPEGLCYQAVMKDVIASANGKDAYLINLCDGDPCFGYANKYYGGAYAIAHTAAQVDKMRKAGIKVLGYYISDYAGSSSEETFKKMYGPDSEFIDTNSLTQLSKSLNKLFERK